MFVEIVAVEYLGEYTLRLTFNSGEVKDVNLENELLGEIFEPLRVLALFQQVFLSEDSDTIEWPNGADFAPECLYEVGVPVVVPA